MTRNNLTSDVRTLDFFTVPTAVPEPSAWAIMLLGFGLAGGALRRRGGVARRAT